MFMLGHVLLVPCYVSFKFRRWIAHLKETVTSQAVAGSGFVEVLRQLETDAVWLCRFRLFWQRAQHNT